MPTLAHGVPGQFSPTLTPSPDIYRFGVSGGDYDINITTDARNLWTLTEYAPWFSVSPNSSMGSSSFIVSCDQQDDQGAERSGDIYITSSAPTTSIQIIQDASEVGDYVNVSPGTLSFYDSGTAYGLDQFTVESNVDWEIPSIDQSEIIGASISPTSGIAGTTYVTVGCGGSNPQSYRHTSSSIIRDVATQTTLNSISFCQDGYADFCG